MQTRTSSKVTDRLMLVLEYLKTQKFKRAVVTWDRIDDPEAKETGVIVVPILEIEL